MKIVKFKKAGVQNFCNHIEPLEIEFKDGHLTLITGPNGCLSGDTEIDIPRDVSKNTSGIKIKDLVGKEFHSYCYDIDSGKMELKKSYDVRKTRIKAEVWKLEYTGCNRKGFVGYEHLIATPDHRVLKSNGVYCQLKDLVPGDSLMSFYRRTFDGYTHIRATNDAEHYEHRFIGESIYGNSEIFHHKNTIRFDNTIDNIMPMSKPFHCSLHAHMLHNQTPGKFMYKEHPRGMLGKNHSDKSKNKISSTISKYWKIPKNLEKQKIKMQEVSNNRSILDEQIRIKKLTSALDKKYCRNGDYRNKEILKELYVNQKLSQCEIAKIFSCDPTTIYYNLKKFELYDSGLSKCDHYQYFDEKYNRNDNFRNKEILYDLYINQKLSQVEIANKLSCDPITISYYLKKLNVVDNNHTVTKVSFHGYEDVYNMNVEECHNFVANGIFVANSGKSSIFQSIAYTLYGTCEKGKGEDVLNEKIGKNCHSWVEFDIDSDSYRVDRYVKYTKYGNTVLLSKNGEPAYKKGQKEVLPEIEKIFVPAKLFMNTMLFSQKAKSFFTDLNDADQKEIFRKVLKLDDYVDYQKRAKAKLDLIQQDIEDISTKVIVNEQVTEDVKEQIKQLKERKLAFTKEKVAQIKLIKGELDQLSSDLKGLNNLMSNFKKEDLDKRLLQVQKSITILQGQIDSTEDNLQTKKSEIRSKSDTKKAEMETKLTTLRSDLRNKTRDLNEKIKDQFREEKNKTIESNTESEKQRIVIDGEINKNRSDISRLEREKNKFDGLIEGEACPTCLQSLKDLNPMNDHIENCESQIIIAKNLILSYDQEILVLEKNINSRNEKLKSFNDVLSKKISKNLEIEKTELNQIQERFDKAIAKLDLMVATQIKEASSENSEKLLKLSEDKNGLVQDSLEIEKRVDERNDLTQQILNKEMEINNTKISLKNKIAEEFDDSLSESLGKKVLSLRSELKDLSKEIVSFKKKQKILTFWKTGFSSSGIQSMLIDEAIPFMNTRVSDYLEQLSGGRYMVSFDTVSETKSGVFKDKINVEVFDNVTHSNKRVKFSGGQERIIDIATILTLSDLQSSVQNVSFNIMLFDEIFDSLDDNNIGSVSNLLRKVSSDKSVFIISHRAIDQIEADSVLNLN